MPLAKRIVIGVGCLATLTFPDVTAGVSAVGRPPVDANTRVITLEQGWSTQIQRQIHHISFGSRLMPLDWFQHLEQADGPTLFRSDEHLSGFGFLADAANAHNPDALPIGISQDTDPRGTPWVGLTCAACHTGEVHHGGAKIRVDGGQSFLDFSRFEAAVVTALATTVAKPEKFERFAARILGEAKVGGDAWFDLKERVVARTQALYERQQMNQADVPYGHGRLDAFGQIFNAAAVEFLGEPSNRRTPNAPVSYPVLWTAPHLDVVQWNASAPNANPGPLVQNVTTALAVYGQIDLRHDARGPGYVSSVDINNLSRIQNWLYDLKSPQWPAEVLGPISSDAAARGQTLYDKHCVACHTVSNREDQKRKLKATRVAVDDVGTDATMAENFVNATASTGVLAGKRVGYFGGDRLEDTAPTINVVVHAAMGAIARHPVDAIKAAITDYHAVHKASVDAHPYYYKARPLDGIWASAPYLHNGSVPTLYDLLLPPEQRPVSFNASTRELDTERVGLGREGGPRVDDFDTTLPGNANSGHLYGTRLSTADRLALIEYLKTL